MCLVLQFPVLLIVLILLRVQAAQKVLHQAAPIVLKVLPVVILFRLDHQSLVNRRDSQILGVLLQYLEAHFPVLVQNLVMEQMQEYQAVLIALSRAAQRAVLALRALIALHLAVLKVALVCLVRQVTLVHLAPAP